MNISDIPTHIKFNSFASLDGEPDQLRLHHILLNHARLSLTHRNLQDHVQGGQQLHRHCSHDLLVVQQPAASKMTSPDRHFIKCFETADPLSVVPKMARSSHDA